MAVSILFLLTGCEKQPEAPVTKKVISKKIDVSGKKPAEAKTPEMKDIKVESKAADDNKILGGEQKETPEAPDAPAPAIAITQKAGTLAYVYDSTGKIDPFESIFKKREEAEAEKERQGEKKKRVPLTPLEKIALSQLKLVAVMLAPSGKRALVEEASGKGYIITSGTYIGKNSGRVVDILLDKVVVEEEVEDVLGKLVVRKTEMKLQKTPGE